MAGFTMDNAAHASTGHIPFFVNAMRHPHFRACSGSTLALEQTQTTADMDLSAAMACERMRTGTRQGGVSVPGTDTVKKHEYAEPA
ncbi:hypothetical protein PHMEG_00020786 [Phytophthora megakarya]|uniref:Reverse transcriptase n=1 Tax=Phytophthora megakarya TaxID=4795 RepID=A0A225VQ49_9STRA|nr:hypothetical protein PHMEG_00020786 [Phytophthora megakarya]